MTDKEARAMLVELTEHYGVPVMPITKYCAAIASWMKQMQIKSRAEAEARGVELRDAGPLAHLSTVHMAIKKSNLLYRLIYLGEDLRTEPCMTHKGVMSTALMVFGKEAYIGPDGTISERGLECGCEGTGWMRAPERVSD